MILNFGDYIFDDGIRGIDNEKPKMINVQSNTTKDYFSVMRGEKKFSSLLNNRDSFYEQFRFNENYYNNLLNKGKIQDAVDYISRYTPTNEDDRNAFKAELASLRQQAKYNNSFKSQLNEDQLNRYNFYNGVFTDGGLDFQVDNPYVKQFNDIKQRLGSTMKLNDDGALVIDREATGLSFYFPSTKRYLFPFIKDPISDALFRDADNGIDDFLQYANVTKEQLINAGVEFKYNDDGSTNISFSKANPLANGLIYGYTKFYNQHWNNTGSDPIVKGLDSDGREISSYTIPKPSGFGGLGDALKKTFGAYLKTDYNAKNMFDSFYNMIEENKSVSGALEKQYNAVNRDYSSIESAFVSDAMQHYLEVAKAKGYTPKELREGLDDIHAKDVRMATTAMQQSGHDFYTSYFNPNKNDDTLVQTEDPDQIKDIINLLNEADPKDVELTTLVSNGVIGTKISLEKKAAKKGETILGSDRSLQVWIPRLFTEQAQNRLNSQPESRAVLELNTMLDTNSTYTLDDGSRLKAVNNPDGTARYYIEEGRIDLRGANKELSTYRRKTEITKEEAMGRIVKDLYMQKAVDSQFVEQIAPSGNIINIEDYKNSAKDKALTIAQNMYKGVDDLVKTDGTLITLDEIFSKKINRNNVSPYVYNKVKVIYDIYDKLMDELYTYEDFQDALLDLGKVRYNYSANS